MISYLERIDSIVLWYRTYVQMRHPIKDATDEILDGSVAANTPPFACDGSLTEASYDR